MIASITRRDSICGAIGAAIAFALSDIADAQISDKNLKCLVGQSSEPGKEKRAFCLGILLTTEYDRHREKVRELRNLPQHRRILRPSSTDRYGAQFCKRFIDYMFSDSELRFSAALVSLPAWPDTASERDQIVFGYHISALDAAGWRRATEVDLVDRRSLRSVELARSLTSYRTPAISVLQKHPEDDDLLQLAAYLASVVRAEGGKSKQTVREHLISKLAVNSLDETSLKSHPKFRVREIFI